jgi:hypothetical protein
MSDGGGTMPEPVAAFQKSAYDALCTQLAYRRDRRHTIFAWCSSILVAIIGGIIALVQKSQDVAPYQRNLITATIGILAVFTIYWIYYHWINEQDIQVQINKMDGVLKIKTANDRRYFTDWMQTIAVVGLAGTALIAIWWNKIGFT